MLGNTRLREPSLLGKIQQQYKNYLSGKQTLKNDFYHQNDKLWLIVGNSLIAFMAASK